MALKRKAVDTVSTTVITTVATAKKARTITDTVADYPNDFVQFLDFINNTMEQPENPKWDYRKLAMVYWRHPRNILVLANRVYQKGSKGVDMSADEKAAVGLLAGSDSGVFSIAHYFKSTTFGVPLGDYSSGYLAVQVDRKQDDKSLRVSKVFTVISVVEYLIRVTSTAQFASTFSRAIWCLLRSVLADEELVEIYNDCCCCLPWATRRDHSWKNDVALCATDGIIELAHSFVLSERSDGLRKLLDSVTSNNIIIIGEEKIRSISLPYNGAMLKWFVEGCYTGCFMLRDARDRGVALDMLLNLGVVRRTAAPETVIRTRTTQLEIIRELAFASMTQKILLGI